MLRRFIRVFLFFGAVSYPLERLGTVGTDVFIFSFAKLFTLILMFLAILHRFAFGRSPTARRDAKTPWIIAFFVSLAISSVYSVWMDLPLDTLARNWTQYLAILIFYFLLTQLLPTRTDLDVLLAGWVVGCAISSVSATFLGPDTGIYAAERRAGIGAGSNENAGNMLLALAISYSFFSAGVAGWKRIIVPVAGALHMMGFLLAASRSAFLGFVGMGSLWALRFRRIQDVRALLMVVLLGVTAIAFAPEAYFERLSSLTRVADARTRGRDVQERIQREGGAVIAFLTHPVIGIGAGRFVYWTAEEGLPVNNAHNAILKVASEQGLVGLIPYLAILTLTWVHLSRAYRVARRNRGDPEMRVLASRAVMLQVGFLGLFTVAMFQPGTLWKGMWLATGTSTVIVALVRIRMAELEPQAMRSEPSPVMPSYVQRA
jgi:O-antigen ligase